MAVVILLVFSDYWLFGKVLIAQFVFQYFCPMILGFYTLYLAPQVIFQVNISKGHARKSLYEKSFLTNLNLSLIFNMIFAPFLAAFMLQVLLAPNVIING